MAITSDKLHVVTAIFNPRRFESRKKLYREFKESVLDAGAQLYTIEAAFGERDFDVTDPDNPHDIQVRTNAEIWQKERMLNIALSRLPRSARYIAWRDADTKYERADWAEETIHKLQHHPIVQMFTHAVDLGPASEAIQMHTGFAFQYRHGRLRGHAYTHWHPGFDWAARRENLDAVGGLIDTALLGAGDHHMAHALIGRASESFGAGVTEGYKRPILQWQERAKRAFEDGNVGYVDGLLRHGFHGAKADRQYESRWKILADLGIDPETDVVKDLQGLWALAGNKPAFRDRLMAYFQSRHEDNKVAPPLFGALYGEKR